MNLCVTRLYFLAVIDSQHSDEIVIDRDSDGAGGAANPDQGDFELNTRQEAEEFDTDLPAEHNVRISLVKLECQFGIYFLNICANYSMHCSILATWNVYQAFSTLSQTKPTVYQYFSMTP